VDVAAVGGSGSAVDLGVIDADNDLIERVAVKFALDPVAARMFLDALIEDGLVFVAPAAGLAPEAQARVALRRFRDQAPAVDMESLPHDD